MISIRKTDVAALLHVAPKRDKREVLNGIHLHHDGRKLTMTATDGKVVMVVVRPALDDDSGPARDDDSGPVCVTVPRAECETIARASAAPLASIDAKPSAAYTGQGDERRRWEYPGGTYPDVAALVAQLGPLDDRSAYLHPMQLAQLQAAAYTLRGIPKRGWPHNSPLDVFSTGEDRPAVVVDYKLPEMLGLIMPFRGALPLLKAQPQVDSFLSQLLGDDE